MIVTFKADGASVLFDAVGAVVGVDVPLLKSKVGASVTLDSDGVDVASNIVGVKVRFDTVDTKVGAAVSFDNTVGALNSDGAIVWFKAVGTRLLFEKVGTGVGLVVVVPLTSVGAIVVFDIEGTVVVTTFDTVGLKVAFKSVGVGAADIVPFTSDGDTVPLIKVGGMVLLSVIV